MAEGLRAPRPKARKPLQDQPRLMSESMLDQPEPEQGQYLGAMSFRKEGKHPVDTKVKFYRTSRENDPRPFVVRDLEGKEVILDLKDQAQAEVAVLGDITVDTMDIINSKSSLPSYKKGPRLK